MTAATLGRMVFVQSVEVANEEHVMLGIECEHGSVVCFLDTAEVAKLVESLNTKRLEALQVNLHSAGRLVKA